MEKISIKELINSTKGRFIFGNPKDIISSISTDTRTLETGACFFALKGQNYDGHDFLNSAIEKGANTLVGSHFQKMLNISYMKPLNIIFVDDTLKALGDFAGYYRNKFQIKVIAITGSNGKTTTKEMLYSILNKISPTIANIKSFNNLVGLPLTLFNITSNHKFCITELGISTINEMDRLIEISSPNVGVVLNIGDTHLEFLKDRDGVFREKKKLLDSLSPYSCAIVNIDDPYLKKYAPSIRCRSITFGLSDEANISAKNIVSYSNKTKFELCIKEKKIESSTIVTLPTVGTFNIYNSLAAAAVCHAFDIDIEKIKDGLESFIPSPMRMEEILLPNGSILVNDSYNANPVSIREALNTFLQIYPKKKKIAVLGDMLELGDASEFEHKKLAEFLSKTKLEKIYLVGEEMIYTNREIVTKFKNMNVKYRKNKMDIIEELKKELDSNVVVFFKASRKIKLEEVIEKMNV